MISLFLISINLTVRQVTQEYNHVTSDDEVVPQMTLSSGNENAQSKPNTSNDLAVEHLEAPVFNTIEDESLKPCRDTVSVAVVDSTRECTKTPLSPIAEREEPAVDWCAGEHSARYDEIRLRRSTRIRDKA